MAYLALNDGFASAIAAANPKHFAPALSPAAPKADIPAGFSALEWSVVMLARHDRPSSLREPGASRNSSAGSSAKASTAAWPIRSSRRFAGWRC